MFPLLTLEIEAETTHFAQLPSSFDVPSESHLETAKELIAGLAYAITLKVTLWDFVRPLLSLTVTEQVLLPLVVKNPVVKLVVQMRFYCHMFIEYNSKLLSKMIAFPKYKEFIADKKYSKIAQIMGIDGKSDNERIKNLIKTIENLNKHFKIPQTLKEYGIDENEFLNKVDELSERAHENQCTGSNARYPLVSEIKELYLKCYYGNCIKYKKY